MTIWTALRALRKRLLWIFLFTLFVTGAVALYYGSRPQKWEGFVTVTEYRSGNVVRKTELFPQPYMLNIDTITRLQNLAEVMGSYSTLLLTWLELKDSGEWPVSETIKQQAADPFMVDVMGVEDLLNRIKIRPVPNTEYIRATIEVEDPDQDRARAQALKAAEVLLSKFEEQYNNLNRPIGEASRQFIEDRFEKAQRDYNTALAALARYQAEHPQVIEPNAQAQQIIANIARYKTQFDDANVQMNQSARKMATLKAQLEREGKENGKYKDSSTVLRQNTVYDQTVIQLSLAKNDLERLLGEGKGENHPQVRSARQKAVDFEQQLKEIPTTIVDARSKTLNEIYQNLERQYLDSIAEYDVASARVRTLGPQLTVQEGKLDNLPQEQAEYQRLLVNRTAAEQFMITMKAKLEEARVREVDDTQSIKMIDTPRVQRIPKQLPMRVGLALLLSLFMSVGLALMLTQVDQGVYTSTQAQSLLGKPCIAALPRMKQQQLIGRDRNGSALTASYEMLSTNLTGITGKMEGKAIVATGAEPNVGRSTVALNLATTLARDGARVVIIDGDLRQPSLHMMLRLENRVGLGEYLAGNADVEDLVQPTTTEGLVFVSAGLTGENPVRLLRSARLAELIEKLSSVADFIVFDSPAGLTFADAGVLSMTARNALVVHSAGTAATDSHREFIKRLENLGVNIVGIALNKVRPEDDPGFMHYQRSYRNLGALRNGYSGPARPAISSGYVEDDEDDAGAEQTAPKD